MYGPYYLYTLNEFWIPENNYVINDYFPHRTEIALNMFRIFGIYPLVDAPVFHINGSYQHGGHVANNSSLSMVSNTATVYYTLDGTDGRTDIGPATGRCR